MSKMAGVARRITLVVSALMFAGGCPAALALPPGFVDELVAGGLRAPTAMAFAPDNRMFVTEQGGAVRVIKGGRLLAEPFVQLTVDARGERGLLGIAFGPNFASNGYVYVYHTVPGSPAHNRITRFRAAGDKALSGSAKTILDLDPLSSATNHNGGALHFGNDGKLYVAVGENANGANAQSLTNRLGKILRLNPDGSIPSDNPRTFGGKGGTTTGVYRAIWAIGLRNPFTFAFRSTGTGMLINDVGQQTWEEINRGGAGRNYGWPNHEGPTAAAGITAPLFAYRHSGGHPAGCAITGGAFYGPDTISYPASYLGKYFFADYCGGWIYVLDPAAPERVTQFQTGLDGPVDLKVGRGGSLWYLERNSGQARRIAYSGATAQAIVVSSERVDVPEGGEVKVMVRLAREPLGPREIVTNLFLSDSSVSVSPAKLTLTPDNWDKGAPITIRAAQDSDLSDDGATVRLTLTGGPTFKVVATARDDDRPAGSPRAVISAPRNGATVSGRNAEFFGDGLPSTVRAQFEIDGKVRYTDINTASHYHIGGDHNRWNTTSLSNGEHLLRLRVFDAEGRSGSASVRVIVDN
ncbi:MAG: PQQ-dependent sugar dehydrogenase [Geminicoccaceae bacterium]